MAYIGQRPVIGRYIKLDQISSGFNGSNTGFSMTAGSQAVFPGTARNLLLSLGGVIQEPDTDFTISGSTLTFTTAPVANTTFFGVIYGDMQATGTPSDGTVLPASIASSGHFKIPQLTVNEDGADVDFRVEGDTEANLLFVDASTDRVGIGTNSPAFKLHVNGTSRFGSTRINSTTESTDGAFNDLVIGDYSSNRGISILSGATGQGAVGFAKSGTTADGYLAYVHNGTATSSAMTLKSQGHIKFNAGSTTKLYIEHDGNVGIGTTTPDGKLDVRGTIFVNGDGTGGRIFASSGNLSLSDGNGRQVLRIDDPGTGNSHSHIFDSNGRLGIGTATPGTRLTLIQSANDNTGGLSIFDSAASSSFRIFRTGAGAGSVVSLQDRGTDVINIKDQQVGIGTTSPNHVLDVQGANNTTFDHVAVLSLKGTDAYNSGNAGSGINFGGKYNSSGATSTFAQISGIKEDTGDGTYDGALTFGVRNDAEGVNIERMRIDSAGRVCIGLNSASGLNTSSDDLVVGNYNVNTDRGITIGSNTNGSIRFADNASGSAGILEYMHGSANLFKMHANGTADTTSVLGLVKTNGPANSATTMITFESGSQARGQIKSSSSDSGNPSFAAYSDYRMKENIRDYTGGWNNIKAVPVKLFDVTTDGSKDQKGWIAHELQAVLPDLVQGAKDAVVTQAMVDNEESDEKELGNPIYQTVSMGLFMPDVVGALQTAIAKIEALETKVAALEAA